MTVRWENGFSVKAVWARTKETPEWLAESTDRFLTMYSPTGRKLTWTLNDGRTWPETHADQTEIVRENVIEARDVPSLEEGYSLMVSIDDADTFTHLSVRAGHIAVGRRLPRHSATLVIDANATGGATAACGDAAVQAMISAFDPLMVTLYNRELVSLARRGGWKIPPAYRLWLHNDVGPIHHLFDGVTATPLGNGTLLTVPDDWPPEPVIEAILNTLTYNNLDEIPH